MARKILVIDDSRLVHHICRLALVPMKDYVVLDAMNGMEGFEVLAREQNVDLILLDINMPIMNGIQFLETIKNDKHFRHIPIIVVSSESKVSDVETAMKLGARGYVTKAKSDELHKVISDVLDHPAIASSVKL